MLRALLLITILTAPLFTVGQNIKGGLVLGFNATQVDGDGHAGFHKLGLNTGVMADVPLNEKFFFTMELLYSQKGSALNPVRDDPNPQTYKLILDYAEVPILFNYRDKREAAFGLGASYGSLLRFKEYRNGVEQIWSEVPIRSNDINIMANIRFWMGKRFLLNLRYNNSLFNIARTGQRKSNRFATAQLVFYLKPDDTKKTN